MKKVLFSAIALFGFMAVNAQADISTSTATNTLADAVSSNFNVNLEVRNVIRLHPEINNNIVGLLDDATEMTNILPLTGQNFFTISSNRDFTVTMTTPLTQVVGANTAPGSVGNNIMPLGQFQYKLGSIVPSQLGLTASEPWTDLGQNQTLVSNGLHGWGRQMNMMFQLKATNWMFEGGNYNIPLTVTATQK